MFSPSYFSPLISFLKNIQLFVAESGPSWDSVLGFLLQPTSGLPLANPHPHPWKWMQSVWQNSSTLPQRDGALEVL